MSLRRVKDRWRWEIAGQVDVTRGVLDQIVMDMPRSCAGPYELIESTIDGSAVSATSTVNADGDRRRLTLRPDRSVAQQWRFRISGLLETEGQTVRAPRVSVLGVGRHRQLLHLPDRGAEWDVASLPRVDDAPQWMFAPDADLALFDMTGRNATAVRKASSQRTVRPTIILADIFLAARLDASCHGVARFDLYPAGRTTCQLRAPDNIELIYVTIDGRVAAVTPNDTHTWEVSLASDRLPQSVEVVFRGTLASKPAAGTNLSVAAPWIYSEDLPLEASRTLWTVGPLSDLLVSPRTPATPSYEPNALDHLRAEAMVIALRGAMGQKVPDDWARPWVARHAIYQTSIASVSRADADSRIDTKLAAWLLSVGVATPAETAAGVEDFGTTIRGRILIDSDDVFSGRATSWIFDESHPQLNLRLASRSVAETPATAAWAVMLALLAIAACVAIARTGRTRFERSVRSVWMRGRYAIMVAVGIVWWLWLWPSFLGLVVVFLAIVLALRPIREVAIRPSGGSSVMPVAKLNR